MKDLTFNELKSMYHNKKITDNDYSIIEENENIIRIESNGNSDLSEFIDCQWYTAYDNSGNEIDFYIN